MFWGAGAVKQLLDSARSPCHPRVGGTAGPGVPPALGCRSDSAPGASSSTSSTRRFNPRSAQPGRAALQKEGNYFGIYELVLGQLPARVTVTPELFPPVTQHFAPPPLHKPAVARPAPRRPSARAHTACLWHLPGFSALKDELVLGDSAPSTARGGAGAWPHSSLGFGTSEAPPARPGSPVPVANPAQQGGSCERHKEPLVLPAPRAGSGGAEAKCREPLGKGRCFARRGNRSLNVCCATVSHTHTLMLSNKCNGAHEPVPRTRV